LLRRIDPALLPLLALPLLILRVDDTWLFAYSAAAAQPGCQGSEQGFIDPWIYFGYFLDLTHHLQTWRTGYFAGRLSWILPGFLAYRWLPPLLAARVLHVAFYWIAVISLYLILKNTVGRRAALLSALLMGCYSYFLWAIGWDYVDGAALTYVLLTLCVLTYAAKSARPRRLLMVSGAAFGAGIYCQFFLISFAPLFALYHWLAKREYGRNVLAPSLRPFLHGLLGITLLFALINLLLRAAPLFFIFPSLSAAGKLAVRDNPWLNSSYNWITGAAWLLFPAVTLFGALLSVNARRSASTSSRGFRSLWQLYFVLSAFVMLAWQLLGQPVLQLVYYTSLLIPATFLALGSQMASVVQGFSRWKFAVLCCCAAVLLFLPFVLPLHSRVLMAMQHHRLLWPECLGLAGVALMVFQARFTRALAVLLVCAACACLSATTGTRTWGHPGEPDDPAVQKPAFLAVVDSVRAVQEIDPTDHLLFWYDVEARLGRLHRSVSSTFIWSRRLVSETFPSLGKKLPAPHTRIAILTVDEGALQAAEKSLRQAGLSARFLGQRTITEGPISWNMILIEVENPGLEQDQRGE